MSSPIEVARSVREAIEDDPQILSVLAELVADLASAIEILAASVLAHEAEHGYDGPRPFEGNEG